MATGLTLRFYDHPMSVWQLCLPTSLERCGDSNMPDDGCGTGWHRFLFCRCMPLCLSQMECRLLKMTGCQMINITQATKFSEMSLLEFSVLEILLPSKNQHFAALHGLMLQRCWHWFFRSSFV